jgi:hypothetical protein
MAKKKKDEVVYVLHDDEPNPFEMREEEYDQAREEYSKKVKAEAEKLEEWRKANKKE